jgi:hypothetical protein
MARRRPDRRETIALPEYAGDAWEPAPAPPVTLPPAGDDPPLPTARALPRAAPLPAPEPVRTARKPKPTPSGQSPPPPPGRTRTADRQQPAIEGPEPNPLEQEDLRTAAIKNAPAWLISFVVHTIILIVLSLIVIGRELPKIISLNVTYAETLGDQLEDDSMYAPADLAGGESAGFSMGEQPTIDPLASPPIIEPSLGGLLPASRVAAPSIGMALTGREAGRKRGLLLKYGGTKTTEESVHRALVWLKRNQRRDGSWSLQGPYTGGAMSDSRVAATAMALIAFQGDGNTTESGEFAEQVRNGWRVLLKVQDKEGNFYQGGVSEERPYSQGMAMIALCEIYGMTKSSMFREPAQRAVNYAVKIQAAEGGWRYQPNIDSDTSVTGWYVMGLQSALMAGLEVPSPTLRRVSDYLDTVALDGGSLYKYQPTRPGYSPAMTAEALLCREYLGWKQNDPRLLRGAKLLLETGIDWDDRDVYFWYYATQVLHHLEGDYWAQWNSIMREVIPKKQVTYGKEEGSWDPDGDRWGPHGGRLYVTCLSTYMLEVYYRHLPIYSYRLQ